MAHVLNHGAHFAVYILRKRMPALHHALHLLIQCPPLDDLHYITTLLSGYSTIPCAFASLSLGIASRTTVSSRMVLTATQSGSLKGEMVGRFNAGSTAKTPSRSRFITFNINPTRPWAASAPQSIRAMFSIFLRLSVSCQAALLAINFVFDSNTVSMMRSLLARRELPVSVTSTMASARTGGFTSVAPHENSTRTGTFFFSKYCLVTLTNSVAIVQFFKSSADLYAESSGTASTQRTLPRLCLA